MITITHKVYLELPRLACKYQTASDVEWDEYEFNIVASVAFGDPGRLSGPPEDCYPPTGDEVVIEEIQCTNNERFFSNKEWELLNRWSDQYWEINRTYNIEDEFDSIIEVTKFQEDDAIEQAEEAQFEALEDYNRDIND